MTAKESKAYRAALVRIVKNAGFIGVERNPTWHFEKTVITIGQHAPSIIAAHLTRLIEQRKRAWERYNNNGPFSEDEMNTCDERCDALQTTVDSVLALFGIRADWGVGLYPVYTVNGFEAHELFCVIRESFQGKVTR